jgi:hypothetical protein
MSLKKQRSELPSQTVLSLFSNSAFNQGWLLLQAIESSPDLLFSQKVERKDNGYNYQD